MSSAPEPAAEPRTFRLPGSAYLIVPFLLFGCAPLAFTSLGTAGGSASWGPQTSVLLVPVLAALFIARTATTVDGAGIVVRALFGRRVLSWSQVRGLTVNRRSVYALGSDGAVRLPCVHPAQLAAVARASGGRLPTIAEAAPKFAPSRRRR